MRFSQQARDRVAKFRLCFQICFGIFLQSPHVEARRKRMDRAPESITREDEVATLAAEIVDGSFKHRTVCLAQVLNDMLDEPLLDAEDTANLIAGDSETRYDILSGAEKRAKDIVTQWLTREAAGQALLKEVEQQERENAEQELNDELTDLIYNARHGTPTDPHATGRNAFPAKLECGCTVDSETECDGDNIWTNNLWTLCEKHEAMGLKP